MLLPVLTPLDASKYLRANDCGEVREVERMLLEKSGMAPVTPLYLVSEPILCRRPEGNASVHTGALD